MDFRKIFLSDTLVAEVFLAYETQKPSFSI